MLLHLPSTEPLIYATNNSRGDLISDWGLIFSLTPDVHTTQSVALVQIQWGVMWVGKGGRNGLWDEKNP